MRLLAAALLLGCHRSADPPRAPPAPSTDVPVGAQPVDLAVGDLDGDGRLDLVSADAGDRAVSVRLQREGAWRTAASLPIEIQPHLVVLADLDADRDLDVVASAHDSGAVYVWRNDGAAGFDAARIEAFAVDRPHNHGLVAGDLDGDGDADVVVTDQQQRAAVALLADGRGGLVAGAPIALAGEPYPPALGDLDCDGHLDLVVPLVGGDAVEVLRGDGAGGFRPRTPHRTARARPYGMALGDLDGDGQLDAVIVHDDTDDVSVLLGDGAGGLRDAPGSPVSLGLRIWRPALADLDGDGALDLAGAGSGALIVARGDGRGGFAHPARRDAGGWVVVAADLDGDGRVDLAAPDPDGARLRLWPGAP